MIWYRKSELFNTTRVFVTLPPQQPTSTPRQSSLNTTPPPPPPLFFFFLLYIYSISIYTLYLSMINKRRFGKFGIEIVVWFCAVQEISHYLNQCWHIYLWSLLDGYRPYIFSWPNIHWSWAIAVASCLNIYDENADNMLFIFVLDLNGLNEGWQSQIE